MPQIEADERHAVDRVAAKRRSTGIRLRHFCHGDNRKLKALACMHRHDAHEIAALRRKRPGASFAVSICAMKDCAIEARTRAPSFSNDSTIRIGFHDVARNRLSLRAEAFKARKPARFFDRLRHDARYGHRPPAGERFFTTPTA